MKRIIAVVFLCLFSAAAFSDGSLYDRNLKANWDDLWDVGAEGAWGFPNTRQEIRLNYHRQAVLPYTRDKANRMMAQWGWDQNSSVIIVFCGFGYIVEALLDRGVGEVTCIERSVYIQTAKMTNEDADLKAAVQAVGLSTKTGDGLTLFTALRNGGDLRSNDPAGILDEDLSTKESKDRVADKLTSNDIHVVTYDGWLQTYSDAEVLALSEELNAIRGVKQVSHMVYFNDAWVEGLQDYSQIQWEVLVPGDEFVML